MKYYAVNFVISCEEAVMQDARDVLSAMAGEAGFESFEDIADGLVGYVQQSLFSREVLDALVADFPFGKSAVAYTVSEAEDRDWNEAWEQEGFDPIVVAPLNPSEGGRKAPHPLNQTPSTLHPVLVIHDGRHLPDGTEGAITVEIDARQAFGTGTHETTRMVCSALLSLDMVGKRLLDCGCGTGILGIVALKLGAAEVVAYDIDEWSVDNCRHNSVINGVDERMTVMHGDATLLYNMEGGSFDVVVANINRNILLADMAAMQRMITDDGALILSGFYASDVPLLADRAAELGLHVERMYEDNTLVASSSPDATMRWVCLLLRR